MKKTINDINFNNKRVFIRCDFNVPLNSANEISNDLRIVSALPTIKKIILDGGKVILASHLGRPKGQRQEKFSLAPVAKRLSELLNQKIKLAKDCIGEEVEKEVNQLSNGQVILLENVRFHKEETSKDIEEVKLFASKLARLADIFVNDAFGTAHRAHASVVGLANYMDAISGYLMAKELKYFDKVISSTDKPVVAIIGGAKVSDKILLIKNMLEKVDKLIIGGGMAYTFRYSQGYKVGDSLLEKDKVNTALSILKKAKKLNVDLILPIDNVIADDFSNEANIKIIDVKEGIEKGWQGVDIGPKTLQCYTKALKDAKIIVWNGPVGVFEIEKFSNGTKMLAEIVANLSATTIIGGGDTASAIVKFGQNAKMSHISTGGGASLELLEGKKLPGVTCLKNK